MSDYTMPAEDKTDERRQIVKNALRTPDGTVIRSYHQHDFVQYEDANGKTYMVDGGLAYLRRSANGDEVDQSVYADDEFEIVRGAFCRGGRGKNGDEPLRWIPLCEMSDEHLQATIQYCHERDQSGPLIDLYLMEQHYREVNGITVADK